LTGAARGRFDAAHDMVPPRQIYASAAHRRMRHRRGPIGPAPALALVLLLAAIVLLGALA